MSFPHIITGVFAGLTNRVKVDGAISGVVISFLALFEDGDTILLEDGDSLRLEG